MAWKTSAEIALKGKGIHLDPRVGKEAVTKEFSHSQKVTEEKDTSNYTIPELVSIKYLQSQIYYGRVHEKHED